LLAMRKGTGANQRTYLTFFGEAETGEVAKGGNSAHSPPNKGTGAESKSTILRGKARRRT